MSQPKAKETATDLDNLETFPLPTPWQFVHAPMPAGVLGEKALQNPRKIAVGFKQKNKPQTKIAQKMSLMFRLFKNCFKNL